MTGELVAVKMEPEDTRNPRLRHEREVYRALGETAGIPRILYFGIEHNYTALVMDRLGPSLDKLFLSCGGNFSLETVLMLAQEMVSPHSFTDAMHSCAIC